jgi:hypothetical protein
LAPDFIFPAKWLKNMAAGPAEVHGTFAAETGTGKTNLRNIKTGNQPQTRGEHL